MALARNIMQGHFSAGMAKAINGSIASGLTAAGTTIADALALSCAIQAIRPLVRLLGRSNRYGRC